MKALLKFFLGWFSRNNRVNSLIETANQAHVHPIEGLGDVHIHPMPVGMRLALSTALHDAGNDTYTLYLWMIAECVQEFTDMDGAEIGMKIKNTKVIQRLGEAVLDESGMSTQAKEEAEKKSSKAKS
jgi:hypothetical protein